MATCPHGYAEPMLCRSCWPHEKVTAWYDQNREAIARAALPDAPTRRADDAELCRDGKLRMQAYYFGFSETGVVEVDRILAAVACAGKGCHNTDSWGEHGYPELIQRWADAAAAAFRRAAIEPSAERVAQLTAHRACGSEEHAPEAGKIHGCCVVCLTPWPCAYAGTPPATEGSNVS